LVKGCPAIRRNLYPALKRCCWRPASNKQQWFLVAKNGKRGRQTGDAAAAYRDH
jgi:hypothetical protein